MALYKTYDEYNDDRVDSSDSESDVKSVQIINSLEQRQELIRKNMLVVIYNYTDWCGPCQFASPAFNKLAVHGRKQTPFVAFAKENMEKRLGNYPNNVQVRGVPCFHFYMNGQLLEHETIMGANMENVSSTFERLGKLDTSNMRVTFN